MHLRYLMSALACMLGAELSHAQSASAASALSEQDFLADVPIVLSVSRLAQRLDETPGAMTILDRDFIRMTGARDVVDVLRFVPGFHTTTSFETDAPMAYYHGRNDDWANRIQVLVDGRSVYSTHLQGSVGGGLQTLALEDIERIEVLRGSNSAAYGARAFLGVVNIVSRDVRDTGAGRVQLKGGENGVADLGASLGGAGEFAAYRLSVDTRGDDGLRKVFENTSREWAQGGNRVSRANFSSRLSLSGSSELSLRAGLHEVAAYRGTVGNEGNLERKRFTGTQYVQADWIKFLGVDEDVRVSVSRTQMRDRDGFPYVVPPSHGFYAYNGIAIDFSGDETNDVVSAQHTIRLSPQFRMAWGGEVRNEQVSSYSSFDSYDTFSTQFTRFFAHSEVRLGAGVLINAGALWEQSQLGGENISPRLMVNWKLAEGQTVRAGVSTAFRPPSYYEKFASVIYRKLDGTAPVVSVISNTALKPERISSRELGYLLDSRGFNVSLDARAFEEHITDGINHTPGFGDQYVNSDETVNRGVEYQLEWKPSKSQRIWISQSRVDIDVLASKSTFRTEHAAPKLTTSLVWMQIFDDGWNVSAMYSDVRDVGLMSPSALTGGSETYDSISRTDVRIGREFKVGKQAVDAALVLQNLNNPYRDGDRKFFFDRRAFLSLTIGF